MPKATAVGTAQSASSEPVMPRMFETCPVEGIWSTIAASAITMTGTTRPASQPRRRTRSRVAASPSGSGSGRGFGAGGALTTVVARGGALGGETAIT